MILNDVAPDGVFNFTTINIPAGVTITFERNSLNTPVFFGATGDVTIDGTINVSGSNYSRTSGPGGWNGGLHSNSAAADAGFGPAAGWGGPLPSGQGNAGGGGGMASSGAMATSRTGGNPALGGKWISRPELVPGQTGGGGSGGGGGGGRLFFDVPIQGGDGGGGGGGLQVCTPGNLTLRGNLVSNGGHGAWAFANVFAHGGPGGGGAGGNIELIAGTLALESSCSIVARGGAGGGLSTEPVSNDPYVFSCGANGGTGYLILGYSTVTIDPDADLQVRVANQPSIVDLEYEAGTGHVLLDCRGVPGLEYTVQGSTDLDTWDDLISIPADAAGLFDWTDESVRVDTRYFYRLVGP